MYQGQFSIQYDPVVVNYDRMIFITLTAGLTRLTTSVAKLKTHFTIVIYNTRVI